jgi:hypothetical protein
MTGAAPLQAERSAVSYAGVRIRLNRDGLAQAEWAKETGHPWRVLSEGNVTWWASRVEHYLVAPPREASPSHWLTEVAILLRD